MYEIYPDYYSDFHCLAGRCPDTCCAGWQVVIDRDTLERYRSLTGSDAKLLQGRIAEQDGEACFVMQDGRCTFLASDGLCELYRTLGEDALCRTCRSHPRFLETYGQTQELTLSVSCPAAAELLLCREAPVRFLRHETPSEVDALNDLDPERYFALREARDFSLQLLQDRTLGIRDRLSLLLLLAARLQRLFDARRYNAVGALLRRFDSRNYQQRQLVRLRRARRENSSFFPLWMLLNNMEHLTSQFPELLSAAAHAPRPSERFCSDFSLPLEHLSVYFIFRYMLKAAADGQLLPRIQACVFHILAISRLAYLQKVQTLPDFCRMCSLYSKEVEHSEENLQLLHRALRRSVLRPDILLSLI